MHTAVRRYDGNLAVSAIVLAAILQVLQITFIADGLERASGQGWFLSLLFAIVISSGLLFGTFVTKHFMAKHVPIAYAYTFAVLAAVVTGGMAAWTIAGGAEMGSGRWVFSFYLGAVTPVQTILLGIMADDLLDMAGSRWWTDSFYAQFFSVVLPDRKRSVVTVPPNGRRMASPLQEEIEVADIAQPVGEELVASAAVAPLEVELGKVAQKNEEVPPTLYGAIEQAFETVFADFGLNIEFTGERQLRLRAENISRNRLKDLRSALQRACPAVSWDNPTSGENRVREMSGTISRKVNRDAVRSALRNAAASFA